MKNVRRVFAFVRKKKIKALLAVVCIGILLYTLYMAVMLMAIVQPTNDRDNRDSAKQREMVKITIDAANLAPIPKNATVKLVKTEGNMFTRSFRLAFDVDTKTLRKWLDDSKGIRTAKVVRVGNNSKYIIGPRHGYQRAEVLVDQCKGIVKIYVESS